MDEGSTMQDRMREMAIVRVSRLNSKPGDLLTSKRMFIAREYWLESGLSFPSGFKDDDQMAVELTIRNDYGEFVVVGHRIFWRHVAEDTYEFLKSGAGDLPSGERLETKHEGS